MGMRKRAFKGRYGSQKPKGKPKGGAIKGNNPTRKPMPKKPMPGKPMKKQRKM